MERKRKVFLTALDTMIKKDPRISKRKHPNELKVREKNV